jgi:hypothetical protein
MSAGHVASSSMARARRMSINAFAQAIEPFALPIPHLHEVSPLDRFGLATVLLIGSW